MTAAHRLKINRSKVRSKLQAKPQKAMRREAKTSLQKEQAGHIVLANQERSPLLRLPGEIRNRIYEYAFSDCIIKKGTPRDPPSGITCLPTPEPETRSPTILRVLGVCHQIYYEARIFLYRFVDLGISDLQHVRGDIYRHIRDAQWDEITTIRIPAAELRVRCANCKSACCPRAAKDMESFRQLSLKVLSYAPAVQRVVVEDWKKWVHDDVEEKEMACVKRDIQESVDDRELEVVFEHGAKAVLGDWYWKC